LYADQYEASRLRELLPSIEFQQAINVIETIAQKTEDRVMYDQRTKAQMDYDWAIEGARLQGREEGIEQGLEQGIEQGVVAGKVQMLQLLLGEPQSLTTDLSQRSVAELSDLVNELQDRLRQRDA